MVAAVLATVLRLKSTDSRKDKMPPESRLERELRSRANTKFPPNPFCSNNVSTSLVRKVLEEAGHKDFRLYVSPSGIYIRDKEM